MTEQYEKARSKAVLQSLAAGFALSPAGRHEDIDKSGRPLSEISALRGEVQEAEDRICAEIARVRAEASASFLDIYKHQWIMALWTVVLIVLLIKLT